MAHIHSIDVLEDGLKVHLNISESEYKALDQVTDKLALVPFESKALDETLTTGRLGNSNRIMLPKKILDRHKILKLEKHVKAKVVKVLDETLLVIQLGKSGVAMPKFGE